MHGACLCGAVGFEAKPSQMHSHACHCDMCRRWTGSTLLSVQVAPDDLRFEGADAIRVYRSSDWAERGFCGTCGSTLFYRLTGDGPMQGVTYLALGLFDTPEALPLASEIYIDSKPSAYALAGAHPRLTGAEVEAALAEGGA